MKFLSLGTIIVGKLVNGGVEGITAAAETDIHLEARHSISVRMCGAYKFVCNYQMQI